MVTNMWRDFKQWYWRLKYPRETSTTLPTEHMCAVLRLAALPAHRLLFSPVKTCDALQAAMSVCGQERKGAIEVMLKGCLNYFSSHCGKKYFDKRKDLF